MPSDKKCPRCLIYLKQISDDGWKCSECGYTFFTNTKMMTRLYAYVSVDPQTGLEGIVGMSMNGTIMAAVHSDGKFIRMLEPEMRRMVRVTGVKIRLVRYDQRTVLEEIS